MAVGNETALKQLTGVKGAGDYVTRLIRSLNEDVSVSSVKRKGSNHALGLAADMTFGTVLGSRLPGDDNGYDKGTFGAALILIQNGVNRETARGTMTISSSGRTLDYLPLDPQVHRNHPGCSVNWKSYHTHLEFPSQTDYSRVGELVRFYETPRLSGGRTLTSWETADFASETWYGAMSAYPSQCTWWGEDDLIYVPFLSLVAVSHMVWTGEERRYPNIAGCYPKLYAWVAPRMILARGVNVVSRGGLVTRRVEELHYAPLQASETAEVGKAARYEYAIALAQMNYLAVRAASRGVGDFGVVGGFAPIAAETAWTNIDRDDPLIRTLGAGFAAKAKGQGPHIKLMGMVRKANAFDSYAHDRAVWKQTCEALNAQMVWSNAQGHTHEPDETGGRTEANPLWLDSATVRQVKECVAVELGDLPASLPNATGPASPFVKPTPGDSWASISTPKGPVIKVDPAYAGRIDKEAMASKLEAAR